MAIPLVAALGLLAGGTLLQHMGQKKAEKAVDAANMAEQNRQQRYQDASKAAVAQSQSHFNNLKDESDREAEKVNDTYQRAITSQVGSYLPGANVRGAPKIVTAASDRATQGEETDVRNQAEDFARLSGITQALFGGNMALNRSGQEVGMNTAFSRGSSSLLPMELQAASQKGSGLRLLGNLLSMGGQMGMSSALMAPGGAPSLFPASVSTSVPTIVNPI